MSDTKFLAEQLFEKEIERQALESERDAILRTLAKERDEFGRKEILLMRDRDALKAEHDELIRAANGFQIDRDHWRSLAEALYLKLHVFDLGELREGNKVQWIYTKDFYESVRAVLHSFDQARGERK